jgi:glycosyltransferase involved in cell wall biosynthesis
MYTILFPVNRLIIGGAEQQLLELVRGLDKKQFQPIVAPLYPGGGLEDAFRAVPGVEVIDLNRRSKYDLRPLWTVTRLLRSRRVDIVQPFLSPATFFGLLPALTRNATTTIVTERCGVRQSRGLGYKTYRTVEDLFSRLADAIVPNSAAGAEMLVGRGLPREKIRVIYNGINLDRLTVDAGAAAAHRARIAPQGQASVAGMLASLTPAKGHSTAIRALASLRERGQPVKLAIVGDGPLRSELEAQVDRLGLTDAVTFFGYQRNVSDFLATFDVLISSSRDNEGCSNSILEAMALGVPVIATDVGGNRELVRPGETGQLVAPDDPASLAGALIRIFEEPVEARKMAGRARELIDSQFSLAQMIRSYEELYSQLLGQTLAVVDADGRLVTMKA